MVMKTPVPRLETPPLLPPSGRFFFINQLLMFKYNSKMNCYILKSCVLINKCFRVFPGIKCTLSCASIWLSKKISVYVG